MFHSKGLRSFGQLLTVVAILVGMNACGDHRSLPDPATLPDANFIALNDNNQLLRFNVRTLSAPSATVSVTGLQSGEQLLAIDFRPATGQLYGIGSTSRLYVINPTTGTARAIGAGPFSPALNGNTVALDFNPTVDRLRLVTNMGQNLRLNPETGTVVATDGAINGAMGAMIGGAAYTNNKAGVTTTILYDIDPVTDRLYKQDPPNNGTLALVGSLGLDITAVGGFDIGSDGNAIVAVTVSGKSELNQIDIATGRLQKLGDLPGNIVGLAIPTEPVAYAVDGSNTLLIFNPMNPAPISKALTGLQAGEVILGIDFRPLNGQLYALGSSNRLYTINTANGAAAMVGMGFATTLSGMNYGFDFNPTVDRIRVVGDNGQNLRLHPDTGALVATDGALNPLTPFVTAGAYTNNFAGTTTTVLYDIDTRAGQSAGLFRQDPPNAGTLVSVGSLGIEVESANGFDIGGASGTAYALLRSGGLTRVHTIDLATGAATAGSILPAAVTVRGFAVGLGF